MTMKQAITLKNLLNELNERLTEKQWLKEATYLFEEYQGVDLVTANSTAVTYYKTFFKGGNK